MKIDIYIYKFLLFIYHYKYASFTKYLILIERY